MRLTTVLSSWTSSRGLDLGTGQRGRVSRIHCTILGPEVSSLEEVIAQTERHKLGEMRPAFHRMSLCKSGVDEDDERGNFGLRVSNMKEFHVRKCDIDKQLRNEETSYRSKEFISWLPSNWSHRKPSESNFTVFVKVRVQGVEKGQSKNRTIDSAVPEMLSLVRNLLVSS